MEELLNTPLSIKGHSTNIDTLIPGIYYTTKDTQGVFPEKFLNINSRYGNLIVFYTGLYTFQIYINQTTGGIYIRTYDGLQKVWKSWLEYLNS